MEPTGIFSGVLAKALISLSPHLGRKAGEMLVGSELLEKLREREKSFNSLLQKAINEFAENVPIEQVEGFERVILFLTSPEVESFVRQIFSATILGNEY